MTYKEVVEVVLFINLIAVALLWLYCYSCVALHIIFEDYDIDNAFEGQSWWDSEDIDFKWVSIVFFIPVLSLLLSVIAAWLWPFCLLLLVVIMARVIIRNLGIKHPREFFK